MASSPFHYDNFPFEFVDLENTEALSRSHPELLRRTIESLPEGAVLYDLGSGPGRLAVWAARRGLKVVALDLSIRSIRAMRHAESSVFSVVGDVLRTPLTGGADLSVLDGVAHHTGHPFKAFAVAAEMTKPGGMIYLGIYKLFRHYPFIYWSIGTLARFCYAKPRFNWVVEGIYRIYSVAHQLVRRPRDEGALRNLFADYLLTPIASFHPRSEVQRWARQLDLREVRYDRNPTGNCHLFLFERPTC